ncbi:hypothetical protein Tco_1410068 [Tanacetum coccineum]
MLPTSSSECPVLTSIQPDVKGATGECMYTACAQHVGFSVIIARNQGASGFAFNAYPSRQEGMTQIMNRRMIPEDQEKLNAHYRYLATDSRVHRPRSCLTTFDPIFDAEALHKEQG